MYRKLASVLTLTALLLAASGCAKIALSTTCPAGNIGVGFGLAGSTVGNQAIAMLGAAVSGAKVAAMAKAGAVGAPSTTTATMSYEYSPIFGADSGTLTCVMPPQQTVVVTSPPAAVVQ